MVPTARILETLRSVWQRDAASAQPLAGGMTSWTWAVIVSGQRYVAKLVPAAHRAGFVAGLAAAEHLGSLGIHAGLPVRAADGALAVPVDDGVLALLHRVPGRQLDPADPLDQQWWGDLLGTVHRALDGFDHPGLARWHWVRPAAAHLDLAKWLRPAVTGAIAALNKLTVTDRLTYGVLHGDPAPDAFLLDVRTGRTGLIDWGSVCSGPLVYDVASAVMYAGGTAAAAELLDGYASAGPVPRDELDAALPVLLRFRWAVQADWFARRIAADDRTGIADPAENWAGLNDARAHLLADGPAPRDRSGPA